MFRKGPVPYGEEVGRTRHSGNPSPPTGPRQPNQRSHPCRRPTLTKRYRRTLAVDDLSFEVTPGVVTGFLGPNGSGKSTTMRMIMGLDNPTSGAALVNGKRFCELRSAAA